MKNNTIAITYLGHSGFLLELDNIYCLFDYYIGQIPTLNPQKDVCIFVSHAHGDHYNRDIWHIRKSHPTVKYIVSKDIPLSASQIKRLELTDLNEDNLLRVKANEKYRISSDLTVETLLSTDEGVAFIINYREQSFFHAGDLNLWTWASDDEEKNQDRYNRFMIEMNKIKDMKFDAAFFPLDPRQEDDCGNGLRIFNQMTATEMLIPMHFWGKFETISSFMDKYPNECMNMIMLESEGQEIKKID
ncbi:MAG: MBL fold metallo-hydrolase [Lachnospiraceae bacterium]|nr:MBL fold metallo-hydrolase [Lachnospiraceae bacterium]